MRENLKIARKQKGMTQQNMAEIEEHARFHMKERHAKRKENDLLTK